MRENQIESNWMWLGDDVGVNLSGILLHRCLQKVEGLFALEYPAEFGTSYALE